MKKFIFALITIAATFATTNCGGSGSKSYSAPQECRSYCRTACSKVALCENFSGEDLNQCAISCVNAVEEDQIATAQSCNEASTFIITATCQEIGQMLGLRSHTKNAELSDMQEIGTMIAIIGVQ